MTRTNNVIDGGGAAKKKAAPKKIKVSQSTIDDIKKLGMTKSLKLAGMNKDAAQAGMTAEFAEGVRRMYGERRYQAAIYKPKASPGPVASPYGFTGFQGPKSYKNK
jgi:hypothetical protein